MPNAIARSKMTTRRPTAIAIGAVLIFAVGLCAISALVLVWTKDAARQRAAIVADSLLAAVDHEVQSNFHKIDLSLQAVIESLKRPDIDHFDPELRQIVLFGRSGIAQNVGVVLEHVPP